LEWTEGNPLELENGVTDGREHPLHQMVSALGHDNSNPAVLFAWMKKKEENRLGPSILEDNPLFQSI